jgi:hypothetical protein
MLRDYSLNPSHDQPFRSPPMDIIKGLALIGTFIGFLTIFAMWVSLWDNVWRASAEPVRGAIYDTRLNRLGGNITVSQMDLRLVAD